MGQVKKSTSWAWNISSDQEIQDSLGYAIGLMSQPERAPIG